MKKKKQKEEKEEKKGGGEGRQYSILALGNNFPVGFGGVFLVDIPRAN
jgi:hypothetical protein